MPLLAIPSIEIRAGLCADPRTGAVPGSSISDPFAVARAWAAAGFRRVHVRDLDAMSGRGSNADLLEDMARDGAVELQFDAAIQSGDEIERLLEAGAAQVVLGARAIEETEWTAGVADAYPGLLVIETDVRERRVVTRGWVRNLPLDIFDLVAELAALPLGGLLVSPAAGSAETSRTPSDLNLLEDLAETCDFAILACGGVSTMNDARALEHRGVAGVVLDGAAFNSLDPRLVAAEFAG